MGTFTSKLGTFFCFKGSLKDVEFVEVGGRGRVRGEGARGRERGSESEGAREQWEGVRRVSLRDHGSCVF